MVQQFGDCFLITCTGAVTDARALFRALYTCHSWDEAKKVLADFSGPVTEPDYENAVSAVQAVIKGFGRQSAVARKLGFTEAWISRVVRGRDSPSPELLNEFSNLAVEAGLPKASEYLRSEAAAGRRRRYQRSQRNAAASRMRELPTHV